jgi:endoglucanase
VNLHHRASYGDTWADFDSVIPNQNILYRVLEGGPASLQDFDDEDDRTNYITNEVAMDYNAAFTGALARSVSEFGGEPLTNAECHLQRYSTGCDRSSRMHCGFVSR